jgi:hypothetical protein
MFYPLQLEIIGSFLHLFVHKYGAAIAKIACPFVAIGSISIRGITCVTVVLD